MDDGTSKEVPFSFVKKPASSIKFKPELKHVTLKDFKPEVNHEPKK